MFDLNEIQQIELLRRVEPLVQAPVRPAEKVLVLQTDLLSLVDLLRSHPAEQIATLSQELTTVKDELADLCKQLGRLAAA
jgi:hypothetical protein